MPNEIKKNLADEAGLLALAAAVASAIDESAIIFLYGPLGAGKTTFVRGFLRALGYQDKVKSPTYTLVEPYEIHNRPIFHFDFYRLNNASELEQIGIQDYFSPQAICLIEWPEKGFPLLPPPDLACYIAFAEDGREVRLEAHSPRGEKIVNQLCL